MADAGGNIMTTVGDIYHWMDEIAPFSTAMDFDNVGLLVGDASQPVERVIVALDITGMVAEEAKEKDAQLVISHHPVIFQPLRRLPAQSVPYKLARFGISAICSHTNLDMAVNGVNAALARKLGLEQVRALREYAPVPYDKIVVYAPEKDESQIINAMLTAGAGTLGVYKGCSFSCKGKGRFTPLEGARPYLGQAGCEETVEECRIEMICPRSKRQKVVQAMRNAHPYEMPAFDIFENHALYSACAEVMIGRLPVTYKPEDFAKMVKERLEIAVCGYVPGTRPVQNVALCSGAGGSYVEDACRGGADAFVTGEAKHHELLIAREKGITLVPAGHYATENLIVDDLLEGLKMRFPAVSFLLSEKNPDPVFYC